MVIVMKKGATPAQVEAVQERLVARGFNVHLSEGINRTILGAVGDRTRVDHTALQAMPGVENVVAIMKPFKMASREFKTDNTLVQVGRATFGDGSVPLIAGPCAIEGREQFIETAVAVAERGALALRGGALNPRTNP